LISAEKERDRREEKRMLDFGCVREDDRRRKKKMKPRLF
jgi:hypothetical protein